jgi:hypothetical protein
VAVAKSAFTATEELNLLSVFGHFTKELACLGVENGCADWHFDGAVFAVFTKRAIGAAALSVGGEDVALITEVEQRPHVAIATENDMTAATAVAAVRTTFRHIFSSVIVA